MLKLCVWVACHVGLEATMKMCPSRSSKIVDFAKLTPSSHMEVGCPGTWGRGGGAGTAEPKSKHPEHQRARPTCNQATSPARQKKKKSCPNPGPSTRCTELEEQWRTYIKDYIKNIIQRGGGIRVGSLEKASYLKTSLNEVTTVTS